jgi:hypothetical protein
MNASDTYSMVYGVAAVAVDRIHFKGQLALLRSRTVHCEWTLELDFYCCTGKCQASNRITTKALVE